MKGTRSIRHRSAKRTWFETATGFTIATKCKHNKTTYQYIGVSLFKNALFGQASMGNQRQTAPIFGMRFLKHIHEDTSARNTKKQHPSILGGPEIRTHPNGG